MKVYDKAHETARALKECQQYQGYLEIRNRLKENDKAWEMFKNFRAKQTEVQRMILSGEEPPAQRLEEIEKLAGIVLSSEQVGDFLRAEMELIKVVEDIQRIIIQAIDLELENM
ncbi:MAG: YlbF family regulator [Chitinophagales bacterium]